MRTHEGQAKPINPEQFQQVIDYIRENSQFPLRDVAIFNISYRAGLRAKEIAGLTTTDILDSNGELRSQIVLRKKTTKGSKGGAAFFSHPELRQAVSEYVKSADLEDGVLFRSKKGMAFSPSSMSRMFSNTYKAAGFEDCKSHTGRRSLAKNLNAQNVSAYNIQKILRHSSINTTVNHYLSVDEDTLANIVGGA